MTSCLQIYERSYYNGPFEKKEAEPQETTSKVDEAKPVVTTAEFNVKTEFPLTVKKPEMLKTKN